MSPARPPLAILLALVCASCPAPSDEAGGAARPPEARRAVAQLPSPLAHAGSAACAECHAEQARAFTGSGHALAARALEGEDGLPFGAEAAVAADALALGRPEAPSAIRAPDREGLEAPRPASHALGGRRRIDLLHPFAGELQVLPLAWSVTRGEWVARATEEAEAPADPGSWTTGTASWRRRCAGCHPIPSSAAGRDVPLSPAEARSLPPGIGCEHCHGPGARHAALASSGAPKAETAGAILRSSPGPFQGCAHCHSRGNELPAGEPRALRAGDPIEAQRMFETAIGAFGPSPHFLVDGRPAEAHGRSVLSLEQSRCFREGGASCLGCHEAHAGGLREPDPDTACRACHGSIASDPAGHARHPVATEPVPLAKDEPKGPAPGRAPGCVDCHAPAVLTLGRDDRVRDHAFGRPEPELRRDFGVPDACTACHGEREPRELVRWLDERFPGRATPRHQLAADLRLVLAAAAGGSEPVEAAVERLGALIVDEGRGTGLRASAARALEVLGPAADSAGPALIAAAESSSSLVAQAALSALGRVRSGGNQPLRRLARSSDDWRVRLAAAAALDRRGASEGAAELEVLAEDERLPAVATAHARLQLGLALLRRGALRRASFQLQEATRIDPELVPAWLNLGVALVGLDDREGARLAWYTVLDLEPGDPVARANLDRLDAR